MHSKSFRLDRFVSKYTNCTRSSVRLLLAQGRILLDGVPAQSIHQVVGEFTEVLLDGEVLQNNTPRYIMLNKPRGVVSATQDKQHVTVLDLIAEDEREGLHIVGRLDFNSTGLLLLTNDGRWSKAINDKRNKVQKFYRVTVDKPIGMEVITAFRAGIYFPFENVTTEYAELHLISECEAEVILTDGRYHQIKRMFGRFQIEVLTLHRFKVGGLELNQELLAEREYRNMNVVDAQQVWPSTKLK